eukprot:97569-Amphidinium_carterae.1
MEGTSGTQGEKVTFKVGAPSWPGSHWHAMLRGSYGPSMLCVDPAMLPHVYDDTDNTVRMLGKMSAKLPMPTQFDGRNPQF